MVNLAISVFKTCKYQMSPIVMLYDPQNNTSSRLTFGGMNEPAARYIMSYKVIPVEDGQSVHYISAQIVLFHTRINRVVVRHYSIVLVEFRQKTIPRYFPDRSLWNLRSPHSIVTTHRRTVPLVRWFGGTFNALQVGDQGLEPILRSVGRSLHHLCRHLTLDSTNQYILKDSRRSDILDPRGMVRNGRLFTGNFEVVPMPVSDEVLSYLVIPKFAAKWDRKKIIGQTMMQLFLDDQVPMAFLPELLQHGQIKWKGKVFKANDYQMPSGDQLILILDLRNSEISAFNMEKLIEQVSSADKKRMLVVIHLADVDTLSTPQYAAFVEHLDKTLFPFVDVTHVVSDDSLTDVIGSLPEQYEHEHLQFQRKIQSILPKFFLHAPAPSVVKPHVSSLWSSKKVFLVDQFRKLLLDADSVLSEPYFKSGLPIVSFPPVQQTAVEDCYRSIPQTRQMGRIQLTFLGTSATVPSGLLNAQSFMVAIDKTRILIDCGQNTVAQMSSAYGDELKLILQQIKVIFISHFHADHHIGLITLLITRFQLLADEEPLTIWIPNNLVNWYEDQIGRIVKQYRPGKKLENCFSIILSTDHIKNGTPQSNKLLTQLTDLGIAMEPIHVYHCYHSTGLIISDLTTNQKVAFSCDRSGISNSPLQNTFYSKVQGCDVLIHECTYSDLNMEKAITNLHSTLTQAVQAAVKTKSKSLILTHFSPSSLQYLTSIIPRNGVVDRQLYEQGMQHLGADLQYSTLQNFIMKIGPNTIVDYFIQNTTIATDMMTLNIGDVPFTPELSRHVFRLKPKK